MTKIKTDDNRIDATFDGKFHAFWHEQVVFENSDYRRDVGYPHLTDMATRLANVRFRVKRTSRR